jgi:hypothetical protein
MTFYGGPVVHSPRFVAGALFALCGDSAAESTSGDPGEITCRDCLRVEIAAITDGECACSSAPEPCGDCERYYLLTQQLDTLAIQER